MADLEGGLMSYAGARWEMAEMRPGNHPFAALADALLAEEPLRSRLFTQSTANLEAVIGFLRAALRRGRMGLVEVLRCKRSAAQYQLSFARRSVRRNLCRAPGRRRRRNRCLRRAAISNLRTKGLAHLHSSYDADGLVGRVSVFHGLPEEINKSLFLAPRLTRDEKREAIVGPARLSGGSIREELVNHLLNKTGPNPDQLPLLQHSLMRMWLLASEESDRAEAFCLNVEALQGRGWV